MIMMYIIYKPLIIGPKTKNSPYQNGFFFFDINYPKDYPLNPPKVLFRTLNKHVRFNPNLYTDGKVCLSIINTWSGPGWSATQNVKDILIVLQSLLHENPIQNEPGYEKVVGEKSQALNNVLGLL